MNKEGTNIFINKNEIDKYLSLGYKLGMVKNKNRYYEMFNKIWLGRFKINLF